MAEEELNALRELARRLRVHYEVAPEVVVRRGERIKVGFEIHLWAVHDKGARPLPGCAKCLALVDELRRVADWMLPLDERPTRAELQPFHPALYESRIVPDSDEVALSIRLIHREGYDRPIDACEERCLRELRSKLRQLGVPER
jgi:hypothetical protein